MSQSAEGAWWADAVVYQVYLRSFMDDDGDGRGDLRGLISRLDYIAALGVDAIWLNPCYPSPQADHGYDISDYFDVDPTYGSLADMDELIARARDHGVKILLDMVANHCSSEHPWFQAALAAGPGSAERRRFHFLDGLGEGGDCPPNNWMSVFGGPAWTRVREPDGSLGQWYLHAFDSAQPDFNWGNDDVATYFDDVMEFWFARGVAGFRIDVAHGMVKAEGLPDCVEYATDPAAHNYGMWDQPGVHDIYRRWRRIGDSAQGDPRYFVGEIWVPATSSIRDYLRDDELHQAFSFDLLVQPWDASRQRRAIARTLDTCGSDRVPAWVLSNHDVHRTVTRYGQVQDLSAPSVTDMIAAARRRGPVDVELGLARARAAAMIELALPGTPYLYQGEELGLPEVLDLPTDARQDPIWTRSQGREAGRDGCRVPMPWDERNANLGFSRPADALPAWLPQPSEYAGFAVAVQDGDPDSMLAHYRALIALRRQTFAVGAPLEWLEHHDPDVLVFRRGDAVCAVNFGDHPVEVDHTWGDVVITSADIDAAKAAATIAPNSGAWFTTSSSGRRPALTGTASAAR